MDITSIAGVRRLNKTHLRFLHDRTIPTNNATERYLRNYKGSRSRLYRSEAS